MNVTILEWDRSARLPKEEWVDGVRRVRLRLKGSYGLRAAVGMPLWLLYVGVYLLVNKYDVVQPQNFDNLIFPILLKPLKRFRIAYDLADFYADAYLPNLGIATSIVGIAERRAIRRLDGLIMNSEGQLSEVGSSNMPRSYTYIYNSPTDQEIDESPSLARPAGPSGGIVLLYAGILTNLRTSLLANLVMAAEQLEGVSLRVVGYGEGEFFFRREFRNTRYLGRLPLHSDVYAETKGCDCMVVPCDSKTVSLRIALQNKLFDALSCSKPFIAQRGTSAAGIAEENGCGFITDFENPSEILRTLETVLKERDKLPAMGLRGRRLFDDKYRWSFAERRLLGLYDEVSGGTLRVTR